MEKVLIFSKVGPVPTSRDGDRPHSSLSFCHHTGDAEPATYLSN